MKALVPKGNVKTKRKVVSLSLELACWSFERALGNCLEALVGHDFVIIS